MTELNGKNSIIRNPNLSKSRVFIGNLPICTKEELESIFLPYGKVLGSLVQKNFGFVQMESEEVANKVASALTKSTFKGNTITVRNAGVHKKQLASDANVSLSVSNANSTRQTKSTGPSIHNSIGNCNDCEIIVVDRRNTKYAEMIEERLKFLHLRVDVLFPNADVPLGKVLSNIASRGCLYAILITTQHEEHRSITVNILHGQPAEHRNMPVDDAIKLIDEDFRKSQRAKTQQRIIAAGNSSTLHLPQSVPIIPAVASYVVPPLKERHPDAMQTLLDLLADNLPLTVLQYDRIIKYLQERRELQMKVELGDAAEEVNTNVPDPEIELQKKILNILNKPSVAETHYDLLYPSLQAVKEDARLLELLKDIRVQKALDALMDTNLLSTVETLMKF
uniref:RRM domain-containing protein n=1 Tax=Glossina palpalis gambiensis TaxID=67801 RepID=A0A1B0BBS9_9MUSC